MFFIISIIIIRIIIIIISIIITIITITIVIARSRAGSPHLRSSGAAALLRGKLGSI